MAKTVNVIGATGLVGRALVKQLLEQEEIGTIRIFTRRETGFDQSKIEEHIIDFDHPETWKPHLHGDVLFSTLGTTLKQAGSKEKQYRVDYTYPYEFAREASANGIPKLVLVSSAGADAKSLIFYSRMKGQLDEAVGKLGFKSVVILRPSILVGSREKRRPAEEFSARMTHFFTKMFLKKYRPIPAETVARAMIRAALPENSTPFSVITLDEIFKLAEGNV